MFEDYVQFEKYIKNKNNVCRIFVEYGNILR